MPKVTLGHCVDELPLTVASVARKIGVSPSTLRTWERRYGLGPSVRTIGAHRRYTAIDIARLERMCALMATGISAADAAHQALAENEDALNVDVTVTVSKGALIDAINAQDTVVARSILDRAIATDGLVHAWTHVICPALAIIEDRPQVSSPGHAPRVMLRQLALRAIQQVAGSADTQFCPAEGVVPDVVIAVPTESVISGHVLAAALQWEGVLTGVLSTSVRRLSSACEDYVAGSAVRALIIIDGPDDVCGSVQRIQADTPDLAVYLVGDDTPCLLSAHVTRLHTLPATVAEIVEIAARWSRPD
ncbi:MerR family transcriptional regulator [Nanchangia anserum]|uniref:MerR family transcriptional regulator n=1 Tax=Nanchangia anserum TaxID=2692125 RepID=A0A8I0KR79_9ACTO|nr:MerR family transcriptional regulator [Nanchangia anserum]MBD3689167.1 MerR family transcriptional regulator [Nanchangia anserum]QOX81399.1 MerR family transcriptional regulator [Nanchangia anserum]